MNQIKPPKSKSAFGANSPPEKPLVVIEPKRGWVALNPLDLWNYRDLLYILVERDLKTRYKQTVIGTSWAILQPLLTMTIFTFFFGRITGVSSDGLPYAIFAYAGLLPWTFFSNAVTNSGNSLILDSSLITKIYFPRMIVPIATVAASSLDFFIAFSFLILMMVYYRIGITVNILMLPVLTVFFMLLATGIGIWMSALNVKYRDVRFALPFVIQIGLFITPIIYPLSIVPEKWHWIMSLNPLTGLIEAFRDACFGHPISWANLGISIFVTIGILIFSAYNFRRMERSFADVI